MEIKDVKIMTMYHNTYSFFSAFEVNEHLHIKLVVETERPHDLIFELTAKADTPAEAYRCYYEYFDNIEACMCDFFKLYENTFSEEVREEFFKQLYIWQRMVDNGYRKYTLSSM